MTGLAGLRGKGYYIRIVKFGDQYALEISKGNSSPVYADLVHPDRWTWSRGDRFFHDCLTTSSFKIKEIFKDQRHGFKVRCDEPKGLSLGHPDAQIVKTSDGLYAVRIREKTWWNPLSRTKFVDLQTQDFSGVVQEGDDRFRELCMTKDKKLAYEVYKACLRERPLQSGGLEVVDPTELVLKTELENE